MKKEKLGTSNLMVSKVILGTWAIGGTMWGDYDKESAISAVETAIDIGINTIDTAPVYGFGHAEEIVGSVLKGKRSNFIIATKCGLDIENGAQHNLKPDFIKYDLEKSLKRLQTDYIDLYQIHWPDPNVSIEQTMEALVKHKNEGKILNIGVCNFSREQIMEASKYADIVSLQPHYSLLERSIESNQQKICIEKGMGIISYGSLGGGMLTGKYSKSPQFKKGDARSFFYRFFKPQYWDNVKEVVNKVKEIADAHNVTPGSVAISWLLKQRGVAAAIVGARSSQQIKDNIAGVDVVLSQTEIDLLNSVSTGIYDIT